jgi:hypothetical protein
LRCRDQSHEDGGGELPLHSLGGPGQELEDDGPHGRTSSPADSTPSTAPTTPPKDGQTSSRYLYYSIFFFCKAESIRNLCAILTLISLQYYQEIGKPTRRHGRYRLKYLKGKQYVDANDFVGECWP